MTGPDHYRRAEELLALVAPDWEYSTQAIAQAQVHATLALAAATAMNAPGGMLTADEDAWREAASAYRPDGAQ